MCSSSGDNLPQGLRVARARVSEDLQVSGPHVYNTLQDLKKMHPGLQKFKRDYPKRFEQMFKTENILDWEEFIITKANSFNGESYKMLIHSLQGEFNRKGINGVHYISTGNSRIKITEIVNGPDKYGVKEVRLEVYSRNKKRWVAKEKPSTLFPEEWSLQQLMLECEHAFKNMKKNTSKEFEWNSTTLKGIPVNIIIGADRKLKSIYPLLSIK